MVSRITGIAHSILKPAARVALAALAGISLLCAQADRKRKVPVLDKLTAGPNRQAFSGKVQSLDLTRAVLNVDAVNGGGPEIFPVRKGVKVMTAEGGKLKLEGLTPGTSVIIYYDQKSSRREVKEIVVLGNEAGKSKTEPPHPS